MATYTITAEAGSYAITGSDATLTAVRSITAEAGSYTIAGADAILIYYKGPGYYGYLRFSGTGIVKDTYFKGSGGIEFSGTGIVPLIALTGSGGINFSGSGVVDIHVGSGGISFTGSGAIFQPSVLIGRGGFKLSGSGVVEILKGSGGVVYSSSEVVPTLSFLTGSGGFVYSGSDKEVPLYRLVGSGGLRFSTKPKHYELEGFSLTGSGGICFDGQGGKIFLDPPVFELTGSGGFTLSYTTSTITRQTWVFNARFQASIFGDFNFTELCRFKGKLYGLASDGLYLISGTVSNENGILIKKVDFGDSGEKKIRSIQLGQAYNSNTEIKASVDDGDEYTANYSRGKYFLQRAMKGNEFDIKVKDVSSGFDKAVVNVVQRG